MNDYFPARRALIDEFLTSLSARTGAPLPLDAPLRRSLASAGKRVRGILTIAVGETIGARAEKLVPAAAALEMIHACSLILDDLPSMDDALLRRGAPALHREFGEDLAILSAVALLNHSYGLIAQLHAELSPRRWPMQQVLQRVVDAVGWGGTIAGEAVDLHSEGSHLDFDTLEFIHSRKTGALFVAAAAVGGMLANIHPAPLQRVEVFAKNLGLAFQITDDVLDVTSAPEVLGKDVGKDEQRLTFVKLAGVEGARKLSEELVETSLSAIEPLGASAAPLRELALMVRDRVR
ncbi:MAG TPA: polyprenyl synthetase family protein [Thermoanaerobaculia bacterium]|nr:polyprenyl synthetase family protein [Thermoanaerobaculia bacterium]